MSRTTLELRLGGRRPGPRGRALASAILLVFCLPFVGFGLFAAHEGVSRLARGGEQGALLLLFGAIFSALPLALLWTARRGSRAAAQREELRARHPDEPWLWREVWAGRRIRCESRTGMLVAWIFAGVWNGVSWPLLLALPGRLEAGRGEALLGLAFPLVGLGLLVWAVRATLRWRRFGASLFELTSLPGVLGGELAGTLHVREGLADAREIAVTLSCLRRVVRGSGRSRTTHEDVLWADEERLEAPALARGPFGLSLPLRFALPFDARASDPFESDDRILWRLEVAAAVPGVDYAARFEVPVFQTAESDDTRTAATLARERGEATPLAAGELAPGVVVRPHPRGGTEVRFAAGRHPLAALLTTLFAGAFGGVTWICHSTGAPSFFTAVFGLFTALIVYGASSLWLGSTRLRVRPDAVEVERRLLLLRRHERVAADAIESVDLEVGLRTGSRVFWDLLLRTGRAPRGRRQRPRGVRIPARLRDRRAAEALVARIADELGL